MQKNDLLAEKIYNAVFSIDDNRFKAQKVAEINNWLASRKPSGNESLMRIVEDWRLFDINDSR